MSGTLGCTHGSQVRDSQHESAGVRNRRDMPMTPDLPADRAEEPSGLLNQEEAARFLRVDKETLRRWDVRGVGPRRIQFGQRFVRYRISDLNAWLDGHAGAHSVGETA